MDTGQVQSVPQTPHHFLGTLLPLVDFEQNSFLRGSQGSMRIENEVFECFRKFFPSLQSNMRRETNIVTICGLAMSKKNLHRNMVKFAQHLRFNSFYRVVYLTAPPLKCLSVGR